MQNNLFATRQTADVDIRILETKVPFLFFDKANTTTAGMSGDSTYANAKGTRAIAFQNPVEGTMTIEAQVVPFKFYALLGNGKIESTGVMAVKEEIKATAAGTISVPTDKGTIIDGSVYIYPVDGWGDEDLAIKGTYADGTFTATIADDIESGKSYAVGYILNKDNVNRVSLGTNYLPKDYFITMSTVEKDENGVLAPFIMTAYKASIQRNLELSHASGGDPTSITLTFDLLDDKQGQFLDLIEDTTTV